MCLGHWLNMEGGREKRIKDVCQVSFLDKLVDGITTKRERKEDKFWDQKRDHCKHADQKMPVGHLSGDVLQAVILIGSSSGEKIWARDVDLKIISIQIVAEA